MAWRIIVSALFALAGCAAQPAPTEGQASPSAPSQESDTPASLAGGRWLVVAVNGRSTPRDGRAYYIHFDRYRPGELTAGFGCNNFQGSYAINGDHLSTKDLAGTEMACGDPEMTFERQGSAVLASNIRIEPVETGRVRLVSEAGEIDLVRAD